MRNACVRFSFVYLSHISVYSRGVYYFTKLANCDKDACAAIMQKIYEEEPSYWPYGCSVDLFKSGTPADSVYLIKHAGTAVGFAGWQERDEQGVKVGYYSIGVLPEHRRNGYAQKAIENLLETKRASVHRIQASVMRNNLPSLALAAKLDVPVIKSGFAKYTPQLVGAVGNAAVWDAFMHRDNLKDTSDLPGRLMMGLVNAGIGVGGGHLISKRDASSVAKGIGVLGMTPLKDLVISAIPAAGKLPSVMDTYVNKAKEVLPTAAPAFTTPQKLGLIGALGLGAGAIAGSGYALSRAAKRMADAQSQGKLQVRLPTRDPNDQETTFEVPVSDSRVPKNLVNLMFRDTRRKLRQETKERTWSKGKHNRTTTQAEPMTDEEEMELQKEAAAITPYNIKKFEVKPAMGAGSLQRTGATQDAEDQQKEQDELKYKEEAKEKDYQQRLGEVEKKLDRASADYKQTKQDYAQLLMKHKAHESSAEKEIGKYRDHSYKTRGELEAARDSHSQTKNKLERMVHQLNLNNDSLKNELESKAKTNTQSDNKGYHAMGAVAASIADLDSRAHKALYKSSNTPKVPQVKEIPGMAEATKARGFTGALTELNKGGYSVPDSMWEKPRNYTKPRYSNPSLNKGLLGAAVDYGVNYFRPPAVNLAKGIVVKQNQPLQNAYEKAITQLQQSSAINE